MLPGLLAKGKKRGGGCGGEKDTAPFLPSEPVETSPLATHAGSIIFPGSLLGKKSCPRASNLRAQDRKKERGGLVGVLRGKLNPESV